MKTPEGKFEFAPGFLERGPPPPSKGEEAVSTLRAWTIRNPQTEIPDSLLPLASAIIDEGLWILAGDRLCDLIRRAQTKGRLPLARRSYSGKTIAELTHLATLKGTGAVVLFLLLSTLAHAQSRDCCYVNGQRVDPRHYITTNPANEAARQNEIAEQRARARIRREREGALQDDANGNGGRR